LVDSARALTGSRYGAITVFAAAGQTPDFIVYGLTKEERQGFLDMPEGLGFFVYLNWLRESLRGLRHRRHPKALNMPDFLPGCRRTPCC